MLMTKCPLCGSRAKRTCKIKNSIKICPHCCVTSRTEECEGCEHYTISQHFQREKYAKSGKKEFIIEIKQDIEDTINKALELIEKARYAQAEALLDKAAAIDPDYYFLAFARGTIHAKKNELDLAISCFDRAIEKFPYFMEAFFNRGMAFKEKMDIPNSVRSFREVLKIGDIDDENVRWARTFLHDLETNIRKTDGIDLDAYLAAYDAFDQGVEYMTRQEWKNAIIAFENCARISPRSPKPYANIGLCKAKLGMQEDAMAAFDKAIELDPHYEPALLNRAALSKEIDMPDGPIPMIEYAKDYQVKGKSLIKETIDRLWSN
jgi:tetratricopeptide (TPR) repeat protein